MLKTTILALREGAFDYFKKPVNFDELQICIKKALKKQETGRLLDRYVLKLRETVEEKDKEIDRRVKIEGELSHNKEYLDNILGSMNESLIVVNLEATIRTVNQATLKLLGYKEEELIAKPIEIIFADEEFNGPGIEDLINNGFIRSVEKTYVSKDGKMIPVSFSGSIMRGNKGEIQGIVCVAHDITKLKQADKKIKHLASFPQLSINPILELDASGEIIFWNNASLKVLAKLGVGEDLKLFFPKDINEIINDFGLKGNEDQLYREVKIGNLIFAEYVHLVPGFNVIRIYVRDITEHKQAEDKVRQLFTAVEQSPSVVMITDTSGNIEYVNPKFVITTGFTIEEVIGKNPRIQMSGLQSNDVYQKLWSTITAGKEWYGELHNRKKSGELYWELASIAAIKDSDGNVTHFIKVSEDITRRKLAEDALNKTMNELEMSNVKLEEEIVKRKQFEQSSKLSALGELAAGIAHEINNPLGFIYANLGNLKKFSSKIIELIEGCNELNIPEEIKIELEKKKEGVNYNYLKSRIINMIDASIVGADRMKKIVVDMKTFTRVDMAEVATANINDSIDTTLGILIHEYKNRIEIKKEYDEQLPLIKCFIAKLNQVFLNLLVNACQAIEGKGMISIRAGTEGDNVVIEIGDNGCGIPDDVKGKILNPFFTTKPVGQGTGLGLSITHEIIQQHKGELFIESKQGEGSIFTIKIPFH